MASFESNGSFVCPLLSDCSTCQLCGAIIRVRHPNPLVSVVVINEFKVNILEFDISIMKVSEIVREFEVHFRAR
jgi:hypothetical protein